MSEKKEMQIEEGRVDYGTIALPEQKAFFSAKDGSASGGKIPACHDEAFQRRPARFGHACPPKARRRRVPACPAVVHERRRMAEEPLAYDHEQRFEQRCPRIELPFQLVDTVETGIKKRYELRAQSLPGRAVRREDAAVSGHRRLRSGTKKNSPKRHTPDILQSNESRT